MQVHTCIVQCRCLLHCAYRVYLCICVYNTTGFYFDCSYIHVLADTVMLHACSVLSSMNVSQGRTVSRLPGKS